MSTVTTWQSHDLRFQVLTDYNISRKLNAMRLAARRPARLIASTGATRSWSPVEALLLAWSVESVDIVLDQHWDEA